MQTFRTEIFIDKNPDKLHYNAKTLLIGSGFSNNMAGNLTRYNFNINSNPYGKIYNPLSIFKLLDISIQNKGINEAYITESEGQWNHFDFHFKKGAETREKLVLNLKSTVEDTHNYLKETDFLIITFGSAFAYRNNETKQVVANCHKNPKNKFDKELLEPKDIVEGFRKIYHSLNKIGNIILVVSPVMHTGDSITLNEVSKSVLRLACHMIMNEFPYVKYFPAYEFLRSDLRDYRFYSKDLIHLNELAMDYIFGKFAEAYMDEDTNITVTETENILNLLDQSPYNPQSESYQQKLRDALHKLEEMGNHVNMQQLRNELNDRLV